MIAAVRTWLTAVAAVSLLLSIVQYITPKGTLRDTASFIGGLLLLLVLLQPIRKAALPDDVHMGLAEYEKQVETYRTKLEEERKKELGTLIESETEAYILDNKQQTLNTNEICKCGRIPTLEHKGQRWKMPD